MLSWLTQRRLRACFDSGAVFAYPTEAVFGLGCNPWMPEAVARVFMVKGRPQHKGLIICAGHIDQLSPFLQALSPKEMATLNLGWPGPRTFVVQLPEQHPWPWLAPNGGGTIALRVSDHSVVKAVCSVLGPVVSTSANPSGFMPARRSWQVRRYFGNQVDCIVSGPLGSLKRPTPVIELSTGRILRR